MLRMATPLGQDEDQTVKSTVWDLVKIIGIAAATSYLVKAALKSFTKAGG